MGSCQRRRTRNQEARGWSYLPWSGYQSASRLQRVPWKKGCGGHLICHASAAAWPHWRQWAAQGEGEGYGQEAELPAVVERLVAKQAAAAAALERRPCCWSPHLPRKRSCSATTLLAASPPLPAVKLRNSEFAFQYELETKGKASWSLFWTSYLHHKCSCQPTSAPAAYNLTTCSYVFCFLCPSSTTNTKVEKNREIPFPKTIFLIKTSVKSLHQPHTRPQTTSKNNCLSLVLFSVLHQKCSVLKSKVFQSQLVMAI